MLSFGPAFASLSSDTDSSAACSPVPPCVHTIEITQTLCDVLAQCSCGAQLRPAQNLAAQAQQEVVLSIGFSSFLWSFDDVVSNAACSALMFLSTTHCNASAGRSSGLPRTWQPKPSRRPCCPLASLPASGALMMWSAMQRALLWCSCAQLTAMLLQGSAQVCPELGSPSPAGGHAVHWALCLILEL